MTDADLIRLMSDKSPHDFTADELEFLRARLKVSPEVRAALEAAVELDATLYTTLTSVQVTVDQVLQRSEARKRERPQRRMTPRWWALIGLTACVLMAVALWRPRRERLPIDESTPPTLVQQESRTTEPAATSTSAGPTVLAQSLAADSTGSAMEMAGAERATTPKTPTESAAPSPQMATGPWEPWLAPQAVPIAAGDSRFIGGLVAKGIDQLTRADFEDWWEPVPGQSLSVRQDQIDRRAVLNVDGWARLRAPWLADTRLTMAPFDQRHLTLYFWSGLEGVALKNYRERDPHLWAAFQVKRKAGEQRPIWWGLLTTDSGAVLRSGAEAWDVSISNGQLQLSIAGTVLLSAPMPSLPTEVCLEGNLRLRGLAWARAAAPTQLPVTPRPNVLPSAMPADWNWQIADDGTMMLQRDADGSVTLTATSKSDIVRAYVDLPAIGLYATLVQIANADPGTGVFLADSAGKPIVHLTFGRDRATQQLTYRLLRPQERGETSEYDFRSFPPPYFVAEQWLELTAGLGLCHARCSADGRHFGHVVESPLRHVPGNVQRIGLFCAPGETPRTIRLQSARVEPLTGLYALAARGAGDLPTDAGQLAGLRFDSSWWTAGWKYFSGTGSAAEFWDRWAIRTLEQGPSLELSDALLKRLVQSAHQRLPVAERWQTLCDVASLSDYWNDDRSREWAQEFAAVGWTPENMVAGSTREAWQRWLTSPGWSYRGSRDPFSKRFSEELIFLATAERWDDVRQQAAAVQNWQITSHPHHAPRDLAEGTARVAKWSKALAIEHLQQKSPATDDVMPVGWRHPLVLNVNKEAYNVHAELQSALDGGAIADACRIVAALQTQALSGLLPQRDDPHLHVALDVALQLAVESSPEFGDALRSQLSPLGELQVRQAIALSHATTLETATVQFWGTPAASSAFQWLGDRRMSLGDGVGALLRYRAGLRWADAERLQLLQPRLMLAEQLTGLPPEVPAEVAATALLSGRPVLEVIETAGVASSGWSTPVTAAASKNVSLQPVRYGWERLARFDGQAGQNAGRGEYRTSDAFARQFAIAVDSNQVYLSNRFQVNAYQRSTGARVWARGLGSEQGEAHAFPFVAMQPVVAGDRLYVRTLAKARVELVCLKTQDGNVLWTAKLPEKAQLLTDPVVLGDAVWSVASQPGDHDQLELTWMEFDTATGELRQSTPLVRLRDAWQGQIPAALAADGPQLVLTLPGAVLKFDLEGTLRWIRRETWLPTQVDPLSENHLVSLPTMVDDRVYLVPPQGRRVLCLQRETGRLLWAAPVADLQGLIAADTSLVLVQSLHGLIAFDASTGERRWDYPCDRVSGAIALSSHSVWAMRAFERSGERGWLQLVELDRDTGRILSETPWDLPEAEDWRFGPWWHVGDDVWALAGQGYRDPHRDLVRLQPLVAARGDRLREPALVPWSPPLSPEVQRQVQWGLPGWQLFGAPSDKVRRDAGDVRGERDILLTTVAADASVRMVRSVSPGQTRLTLRIGREPNQACRCQVLYNDELLLDQPYPADAPAWQTFEVALPLERRADGWLQVVITGDNQSACTVCWKSLLLE